MLAAERPVVARTAAWCWRVVARALDSNTKTRPSAVKRLCQQEVDVRERMSGLGLQDARLSAHVAVDDSMDHAWIRRKMLHQYSSLKVDEWRTAMRKVGVRRQEMG